MMRVRIVESCAAGPDRLARQLRAGAVYDLDRPTASYLILRGVAQPAPDARPALVVRGSEIAVGVFAGGLPPIDEVADELDDDESST